MTSNYKAERNKLLKKIAEKRANIEKNVGGNPNIKIPRVSMPSDYEIHSQPLFEIPMEIVRPIYNACPVFKKKLQSRENKSEI